MKNEPRISVIIPNLNQAEYLERAICSVLDQGYENLELIVIDGGSDDSSATILRQYDADLAYWHSEMNSGPADAINQGLARATGEIVSIMHADDLYLPGALDAAADAMVRHDKADWAVSHCLRIDENGHKLGQLTAASPSAKDWHLYLTHEEGVLPIQASFYKRSLFDRFGGMDASLQYAFDFEWHARLLHRGYEPAVMDFVLTAQREHLESRSAANVVSMGVEHIDVALRHGEKLPIKHRFALWQSCDEKRRIYTIAASEIARSESRRFLWQQLLRRPWWLASTTYRTSLLRGVTQPIEVPTRRAA